MISESPNHNGSDYYDLARNRLVILPTCDVNNCTRKLFNLATFSASEAEYEVVTEGLWKLLSQPQQQQLRQDFPLAQFGVRAKPSGVIIKCPNGCEVCDWHLPKEEHQRNLLPVLGHIARHYRFECQACGRIWYLEIVSDSNERFQKAGDITFRQNWVKSGYWDEGTWMPLIVTTTPNGDTLSWVVYYNQAIWLLSQEQLSRGYSRKPIVLKGHESFVPRIVFSPNGRMLASGSRDGTVRLWDAASGAVNKIFPGQSDILTSLAFSLDGHFLTAVWYDLLRTWDTRTGSKVNERKIYTNNRRHTAAFSNNGEFIAMGTGSTIEVRNISNWRKHFRLEHHQDEVWAVRFDPKSKLLASSDIQKKVIIWDLISRQKIHELTGHTDIVHDLVFSPDGRILATASLENDQSIKLWDVSSGSELMTLRGHTHTVWDIEFSQNGKWLVSGSEDGKVCIWAMNPDWHMGNSPVHCVPLLPSSPLTEVLSNRLYISGQTHYGNYQSGLALSPNGQILAYATRDNNIEICDVSNVEAVTT